MDNTYWLKQTKDNPLFPDLIWSRPEHKQAAGKLLIIGGNAHGFSAPAEAYKSALAAGIGSCRILMPDAIKKLTGGMIDNLDYAPSTPSGSFSKSALDEVIMRATWADAILLAGDFGRNSETAILLEKFLVKYSGLVTLTKDATDYGLNFSATLLSRPNTLIVFTIAQLQKLFINTKQTSHISFDMDLTKLVQVLHEFTAKHPTTVLVKHYQKIIVSRGGQVTTTETDLDIEDVWRIDAATKATVWWLQNQTKVVEAITTSLLEN